MFSPSQPRDANGRWTGNGDTSRYPVTSHAGAKSVHGKPALGAYALGPGFTMNKHTGKPVTKGYAVAGGGTEASAIGGGGGWPTERVNIVSHPVLAKSLGRKRDQIAIFDLKGKKEIPTGGKDHGRQRRSAA